MNVPLDDRSSASGSGAADRYPLAGIRVLDFTHVLAGPYCTLMLASMGADVVRIESNRHPDSPWRSSPRPDERRSPSFLITNRNKRSIALDLKTGKGHDIAARLASAADIVVENFSAGVMGRLKLDYDSLVPVNPRLIFVSMSGYGHDGPRRHWASMNMNLQALSGLMLATGADGDPPTAISNSWNDYIGALHASFGILQALAERHATGAGRYLDLAQFECSVSLFGGPLLNSIVHGNAPPRRGNRSSDAAPQGVYPCDGTDEWCAISVRTDDQWAALAAVMGEPTWVADEGFATAPARVHRHDEIDERVKAWTAMLPAPEVEARLKAVGVSAFSTSVAI